MKAARILQKEVTNLKHEFEQNDSQLELKASQIQKQNTYITSLEAALIELKKSLWS